MGACASSIEIFAEGLNLNDAVAVAAFLQKYYDIYHHLTPKSQAMYDQIALEFFKKFGIAPLPVSAAN
jgi:hypothetical protein